MVRRSRESGCKLRSGRALLGGLIVAFALSASPATAGGKRHPLTIDDVLDTVAIDRVTASPDGESIAAVLQRPARAGEVFGRNAYETDPSRNDVWLVSRRTGARRNLTNGRGNAAGFWCATWSPDGRKLAMLSTMPEHGEPHGGDNVRLYVWDSTTDTLARMSDAAMMTQTRYGSPLYTLDLRGGADGGGIAHECSNGFENAPFAWLDDHRLLALMLPDGQISALLDEYNRPFDQAAATRQALHDGSAPTVTAVGSGAERMPRDEKTYRAILRKIDIDTRAATTIADVPTYPFQGALTLAIAPDRRRIAILATIGAIQPTRGLRIPHHDDAWQVEKQLGFVDIAADAKVRWATLPTEARYPVELLTWSPDSRSVALRARAVFGDTVTPLFVASARDLSIERRATPLTVGTVAAGPFRHEPAALWADSVRLLVQGRENGATRDDWWLAGPSTPPVSLTKNLAEPVAAFRRADDGRLVGLAGRKLMALDLDRHRLAPVSAPPLPESGSVIWPLNADRPAKSIVVSTTAQGEQNLYRQALDGGAAPTREPIPAAAKLLDVENDGFLWRDPTKTGLFLRETSLADGTRRDLLALDTHLAAVDWGRTMLIDYTATDGRPLKGAVILPPDYREGRKYPTITWVYRGYRVTGLDDYFLDPYLPGLYNLQLYAAHGYVVLIPSLPLRRDTASIDSYTDLANGALPAIDRLVALGITDPARVGVMGQSFGGYSVYSLITQTNRFKAAVALAGLTDLAQLHDQFDPTARGYPGIEHEKSNNWSILEAGSGFGVPPYEDQALYRRNSPLADVDRVETPLLLVHGEFDKRGPLAQAETFFDSLYRQGKTARLLRYWGESHSLAQSPANVRDIVSETLRWFDRYLAPPVRDRKR